MPPRRTWIRLMTLCGAITVMGSVFTVSAGPWLPKVDWATEAVDGGVAASVVVV